MSKLKVVSVFSGVGGIDFGFHERVLKLFSLLIYGRVHVNLFRQTFLVRRFKFVT